MEHLQFEELAEITESSQKPGGKQPLYLNIVQDDYNFEQKHQYKKLVNDIFGAPKNSIN